MGANMGCVFSYLPHDISTEQKKSLYYIIFDSTHIDI